MRGLGVRRRGRADPVAGETCRQCAARSAARGWARGLKRRGARAAAGRGRERSDAPGALASPPGPSRRLGGHRRVKRRFPARSAAFAGGHRGVAAIRKASTLRAGTCVMSSLMRLAESRPRCRSQGARHGRPGAARWWRGRPAVGLLLWQRTHRNRRPGLAASCRNECRINL